MPYVSCMYALPELPENVGPETKYGENARITCIDDQGRTWFLTEDSDVGDWLEFVAGGGTVEPYQEPVE